jgi:hypothetical protein
MKSLGEKIADMAEDFELDQRKLGEFLRNRDREDVIDAYENSVDWYAVYKGYLDSTIWKIIYEGSSLQFKRFHGKFQYALAVQEATRRGLYTQGSGTASGHGMAPDGTQA